MSDITIRDDYQKVLVRTRDAGVFAGALQLDDNDPTRGRIHNARRISYWAGAATLSELATYGTSKPNECRFPTPVDWIDITGIIEILPLTINAEGSIASVPIWSIR